MRKERELLQKALEALDSVDEITAFGGEGEVVFCEVRCDIDKIIIAAKEIRDHLTTTSETSNVTPTTNP